MDKQAKDKTLEQYLEREALSKRLSKIRKKIIVLSGKGGVGKSTVAANLAISLALNGMKVGLMDVDIHGPSIPKLFNLEGQTLKVVGEEIQPVQYTDSLKIMSIGLLLRSQDDAVVWRGPMKMGAIKQFIKDVNWGELDYLIVDSPPGTGDEPLSVCQLIYDATGAIVVTTPQDLSVLDVRKCITFCRQLGLPVIGVIENMSGFVCPFCKNRVDIFKSGGGSKMAIDMAVPFLGRIPIDPDIVKSCDEGKPYIYAYSRSEAAKEFESIVGRILEQLEGKREVRKEEKVIRKLRIAVPVASQKLSPHFGHCDQFYIFDVDEEKRSILKMDVLDSPPHQPGMLPRWLKNKDVNIVITGGMGERAKSLFRELGVEVIVGAPQDDPRDVVSNYLAGNLELGENVCDH